MIKIGNSSMMINTGDLVMMMMKAGDSSNMIKTGEP